MTWTDQPSRVGHVLKDQDRPTGKGLSDSVENQAVLLALAHSLDVPLKTPGASAVTINGTPGGETESSATIAAVACSFSRRRSPSSPTPAPPPLPRAS